MKFCRVLCAATVLFVCSAVSADVRPISDAERAGVEVVARYLAEGPQAIAANLSAASPLRTIEAPLLLAEIETRLGPRSSAEWKLDTVVEALKDKTVAFDVTYPSGIDDTIFLDVVSEGGAYRIHDIRMLAMPSRVGEYYPAAVPVATTGKPKQDKTVPLVALTAALFALGGLCAMPFQRRIARTFIVGAMLVGSGAVGAEVWRMTRRPAESVEVAKKKETGLRLAQLLELRSALATGGDGVDAAAARAPKLGTVGDIGKLWIAQWELQQGKLPEVERVLQSFPVPSNLPLAEMLRARVALVKNDPASAIVAYQRAINRGPGRDSLWLEASSALFAAGFEKEAKATLERAAKLGSREADLYYVQAMMEPDPEKSEVFLQRAWTMQPAERRHLLASGVLWSVVRKRGPMLINLSDPREATFASPAVSTRPIALATTTMATVSGEFMSLEDSNGARMSVPGGAALAPVGAPSVDAGTWSRNEEEAALRAVPSLLALKPPAASYAQPALRERITKSAEALAKRNRWQELIQLTENITPKSEFIPSALFLLRANALEHVDRAEDSRQLLTSLATSPVLTRKRDINGLEQLGDMLASHDMFRPAVKMYERASSFGAQEYADIRIEQISMDERLARQYQTHRTPHFEIHYPPEVSPVTATGFGLVLEAELKRLQRWVPVQDFKPVVVNIVWWHDFKSTYTKSENILGFYNGKITLPLAGVWDMNPMIVSLMTHELCHAMIAQATHSQAPRWFQEGLAQRVEMVPYSANAFNMYEDGKLLAVSVLDPVLAGTRDPDMMGVGYVISETFVRYIEQSLGEAGIRSLLSQFAAGATSEEAISIVSHKSLADFDVAFRAWGKSENHVFANGVMVRYDEDFAGKVDKKGRP